MKELSMAKINHLPQRSVLVFEDDPISSANFINALNSWGDGWLTATSAKDEEEVVRRLREPAGSAISGITLDMHLVKKTGVSEEKGGFRILDAIRTERRGKELPVLIRSGY